MSMTATPTATGGGRRREALLQQGAAARAARIEAEDLARLERERSADSRAAIAQKFGRLFDELCHGAQRELADAVLRLLARDLAKEVRAALTEAVADSPNVPHEVACRLVVSRHAAQHLVSCGRGFAGMFWLTGELLEQGLIDYPRAQLIVSTLEPLPAEVAAAVQEEVIDTAPGRTLRQLREDLAKAIIAVDPDSADERHRSARSQRRVNHPRALPDGMAAMTAVQTRLRLLIQ